MNDREMLEYAARAAGIHLEWIGDAPKEITSHWSGNYEEGEQLREWDWNPLVDDGDAFRLAVKLRMAVAVFDNAIGIGMKDNGYQEHDICGDHTSATRRAIVLAAAEIGKKMEKP